MSKVKCSCEAGFHKNSTQRLKCLQKRGEFHRKGVRRLDPVVNDLHHQTVTVQKQSEESATKLNDQDHCVNAPQLLSNHTFDLEISLEKIDQDGPPQITVNNSIELRSRHFARTLNINEPSPPLNILKKLEKQCDSLNDFNYERAQSIYGKKVIIDRANEYGAKREQILRIVQDKYVQYTLREQLPRLHGKKSFDDIRQYVERKQALRSRCIKDWQKYVQQATSMGKLGSFGKYNSRFQPIQEFLEDQNWDQIIKQHKRKVEKDRLSLLSPQQLEAEQVKREEQQRKQRFFNKFVEITMENEVSSLFCTWKSTPIFDSNGEFIELKKVKTGEVSKADQELYRKQHREDPLLRQRFQKLDQSLREYTIRFFEISVHEDIISYRNFADQLEQSHIDRRNREKERQRLLKEQFQHPLRKNTQLSVSTPRQTKESLFQSIKSKEKIVISTEQDLINYLHYRIDLLGKLDKDVLCMNIAVKLTTLGNSNTILLPENFYYSPFRKQKTLVYFKDCEQTRRMLSKHLEETTLCYETRTKGYHLQQKCSVFSGNQQRINDQTASKIEWTWNRAGKDIKKQLIFFSKYGEEKTKLFLFELLNRLQFQVQRSRHIISIDNLLDQGRMRWIMRETIEVFKDLLLMDDCFIVCSSLKEEEIEITISKLKDEISKDINNQ